MEPNEWKEFKFKRGKKISKGKALGAEKMLRISGLAAFLLSDTATAIFNQGYKFYGVRMESVVGNMKKYVDIEEPTSVFVIEINNPFNDYAVFYKPQDSNSKSK